MKEVWWKIMVRYSTHVAFPLLIEITWDKGDDNKCKFIGDEMIDGGDTTTSTFVVALWRFELIALKLDHMNLAPPILTSDKLVTIYSKHVLLLYWCNPAVLASISNVFPETCCCFTCVFSNVLHGVMSQ